MLTLFFEPVTAYRILTIALYVVCAIAVVFGTTCAIVLVRRMVGTTGRDRVIAYLDTLMQDDAQYMEDESYRREEELAYGDAKSRPLAYFGARYLIERRLHRIVLAVTYRIYHFQRSNFDLYYRAR